MSEPASTPLVDVELTPVARTLAVAYAHDVDLDADQELALGDRVELRDEGGALFAATVEASEPTRTGRKYRLRIGP